MDNDTPILDDREITVFTNFGDTVWNFLIRGMGVITIGRSIKWGSYFMEYEGMQQEISRRYALSLLTRWKRQGIKKNIFPSGIMAKKTGFPIF